MSGSQQARLSSLPAKAMVLFVRFRHMPGRTEVTYILYSNISTQPLTLRNCYFNLLI